VAHIAALYDLSEPLDRWLTADPQLVKAVTKPNGTTLLSRASWGAENSVRVLLEHRADPTVPDKDGWHPIVAAIQTGSFVIFDRLVGFYPNGAAVIGPQGITLIHEAARAKNPVFLHRLLHTTDLANVVTEARDLPLHFAVDDGRIEQACTLLSRSDATALNGRGQTILRLAAANNDGTLIESLLEHHDLSERDRTVLLTGKGGQDAGGVTPLAVAALEASPDALATLLAYCNPSDECHRVSGRHPIALAVRNNHPVVRGALRADRASECVGLLLADGRLGAKDAADAREAAKGLRDVQRRVDEWLIARGDFDGVPVSALLSWLAGARPLAAVAVVTRVAGILDTIDKDGIRGATLLLRRGHSSAVAAALEHGVQPTHDPELFRLEAALRLVKEGATMPANTALPLHPLVERIANGQAADARAVLLGMLPDLVGFRSLLHRLAIREEVATFRAIVDGLRDPIPRDRYDRLPSALAPSARRAVFAQIEADHANKRGVQ
jgi:ankyrin repeat protein